MKIIGLELDWIATDRIALHWIGLGCLKEMAFVLEPVGLQNGAKNMCFLDRPEGRDASLPTKVGIPTFLRFLQKFPTFLLSLNVSPEPSKMAPSNPKMPKISRGFAPGPHWGAYSAPNPPAVRTRFARVPRYARVPRFARFTRYAREHFLLFQL